MYSTYKYMSVPGNAEDSSLNPLDLWEGLAENWFYTATELAGILDGTAMLDGVRIIEMKLWDFPCFIRFHMGDEWKDDIELDPDFPPTQVPFSPLGFQVRNKTATEVARFEIDAYW